MPSQPALTYSYSGVVFPKQAPEIGRQAGLEPSDLAWLTPRLKAARQEIADDLAILKRPKEQRNLPPEKDPLDSRFVDLPKRMLDDLQQHGEDSEIAKIREAADRLAGEVDRVVVLGIGGSYMGARALFEAICHPYYNELSREQRGGRPRIYFEGNNVDNEAVRGLLDLVSQPSGTRVEDRWGIIVISKSGSTLETAVAFRLFVDALRKACGGNAEQMARRIAAVTSRDSQLWQLSRALGVQEQNLFTYPDDVGGRFSVLTSVGLLPAAAMGLDIESVLKGAAAMTERFMTAEPGSNPVLDYVGVCRLMETRRGATIRVLSTWGKRLESLGLWYDQLLSESLGKNGQGATPITAVNTRDLHSRGQQHQEGRRDKLITNVVVEKPTDHPLAIPSWPANQNQDKLNSLAGKTLPQVLEAAIAGTNQAYLEDFRPTASINLPQLSEHMMGQLFQMLMLTTAVEGRLMGINPYGQPGVEAYKRHMKHFLGVK